MLYTLALLACSADKGTGSDTVDSTPEGEPPPVLYIVSMMHAEDSVYFQNDDKEGQFTAAAEGLRALSALFVEHGATFDVGPDWTFLLGVERWDPTLLHDLIRDGQGVQTHAHGSVPEYGLEGVNELLADGDILNSVANGGFDLTAGGGNWVAAIGAMEQKPGVPRFDSVVGFKDTESQLSDGSGTCFRPSTEGDWRVPDPDGPLMYLGSNSIQEKGAGAIDFETLRPWVDDRLASLDPDAINTLYWHDSVHNYDHPSKAAEQLLQWEAVLPEYFDPLVEAGRVQWVTFEELVAICIAAEGA